MRFRRRRGEGGGGCYSFRLFKALQEAPDVSATVQYPKNRDSILLRAIED